jgi:DNA-binding NarL/FixJ family response regulator
MEKKMKVSKSKCIVIATTSKNFSAMITEPIKKYCQHNIIAVYSEGELKSAIETNRPYLVFVDSCAWQSATAYTIDMLNRRFPKMLIAVFSYEAITLQEAVALVERGARGMVNIRFDEYAVSRGIKMLVDGREYIPEEVEEARDVYAVVYDFEPKLTHREEQIYRLLLEAKGSAEIAEKLHITNFTVKNHRQNIYRKCGVKTVYELWQFAQNRGDCIQRDSFTVKQTDKDDNQHGN